MSKIVYESLDQMHGFRRGVEPMHAMGHGMKAEVDDFIKNYRLEHTWDRDFGFNDFPDLVSKLLAAERDDLVQYLLQTYTYDKDEVLDKCLNHQSLEFMDYLISNGASFKAGKSGKIDVTRKKAKYVALGGKLITFTPDERLLVACQSRNFMAFKTLIEQGVKLTYGQLTRVFKPDYDWPEHPRGHAGSVEDYKILDYLRTLNLDDIVSPKEKKIDKMKMLLGVNTKDKEKKYPHGYKIYRILKFIDQAHPNTRRAVTEFVYNLGHGANAFNPILNGSYWVDGWAIINPSVKFVKDEIHLNAEGKEKLAKLEKKFGPMNIDSYI